MHRLYKASLILGGAPLIAGTAIFVLWLVTRADVLMVAGLYVIYAGIGCGILGIGCLVGYLHSARAAITVRRNALVAGGLLVLNVPVCMAIIFAVIAIETRYVVTLTNESDVTIDHIALQGPEAHHVWTDVPAGTSVSQGLYFSGPGTLTFEGQVAHEQHTGHLSGYVTRGLGGSAHLRFTDERSFTTD